MSNHIRVPARLFQLALLLLAIAPSFCAVPGITTPMGARPAMAASRDKFSLMVWGDPVEKKAYDALIASYSEKYPDVTVELIYTPNQLSYLQRLAIDFAAGTPADVFLLNYRRYASFAAKDLIEPLDDYVAASSLVHPKDFYPEALQPYYWQGKLLAIPQNISSLVVYYNKTLFDAAGLPYPKNDWTWDQFVETARALTKDTNGDGTPDQYGLGTEAIFFRVAPFIWQNGGEMFDDPAAPTKLTLNSPATREAVEWFMDLSRKHHIVPDMFAEKAEPSVSRFLRGTMGMYFDSRRGVPVYRTIKTFDWDVAPLPRGKVAAGILHSDAYFMAKASKHKSAAWSFIEYANSSEGQTIMAATGRTVPSRKAIASSPTFLDPSKKPANSQVFLDVIPHVRSVPVMENWPDIESQLGEEVERCYHGLTTLEEAIRLATERTAGFFPKKLP